MEGRTDGRMNGNEDKKEGKEGKREAEEKGGRFLTVH